MTEDFLLQTEGYLAQSPSRTFESSDPKDCGRAWRVRGATGDSGTGTTAFRRGTEEQLCRASPHPSFGSKRLRKAQLYHEARKITSPHLSKTAVLL